MLLPTNVIVVRAMIATCLAIAVFADAKVHCTRVLTVAYYDAGAFYDPETRKGIDRDVIDELSKRIRCPIHSTFWSRVLILHAMESGKLDIATSAISSPQRLQYSDYVPYFRVRNELITTADRDVHSTPKMFMDDPKLRLGVIKKYLYGAYWDEWIAALLSQGRVVIAADTHELLHLLETKRIDGFPAVPLSSGTNVWLYGEKPTLRRLKWFSDSDPIVGGLLLSTLTLDSTTRDGIHKALIDMLHDGTLTTIFSRYVTDKSEAEEMLIPGTNSTTESSVTGRRS